MLLSKRHRGLGKGWPSTWAGLGRQLHMLGGGCSGTAELGHSGEHHGHHGLAPLSLSAQLCWELGWGPAVGEAGSAGRWGRGGTRGGEESFDGEPGVCNCRGMAG